MLSFGLCSYALVYNHATGYSTLSIAGYAIGLSGLGLSGLTAIVVAIVSSLRREPPGRSPPPPPGPPPPPPLP